MPGSLSPDNYSFEGFGEALPHSDKAPQQNLANQAHSLYEETNKLLALLKETDSDDTQSYISIYRALKSLKKQAKHLLPTTDEPPSELGDYELSQSAHDQLNRCIRETKQGIQTIKSEKAPRANFTRFIQGDPKTLLYIKLPRTSHYTVIGNKDNISRLIQSGNLSSGDIHEAVNQGQFGIINLRDKICTTCSDERALTNLITHPNLNEVNKKAHSALESGEISGFKEFSSSPSMTEAFQQEYHQDLLNSFDDLDSRIESGVTSPQTLSTRLKEKVKELKEKNKEEKKDKKKGKSKKSYGSIVRARDQLQDAAAAKKKREKQHDERIETKLKQLRDDDQRIETREDTNRQRGLE